MQLCICQTSSANLSRCYFTCVFLLFIHIQDARCMHWSNSPPSTASITEPIITIGKQRATSCVDVATVIKGLLMTKARCILHSSFPAQQKPINRKKKKKPTTHNKMPTNLLASLLKMACIISHEYSPCMQKHKRF